MKLEDMDVYKNGKNILKEIYSLEFPDEEKFGLKQQMIRAGQSILLNLAEAQAYSQKQKLHFYRIALGSCLECLVCCDIYNSYINKTNNNLVSLLNKECAIIQGMIKKLSLSANTITGTSTSTYPE